MKSHSTIVSGIKVVLATVLVTTLIVFLLDAIGKLAFELNNPGIQAVQEQ